MDGDGHIKKESRNHHRPHTLYLGVIDRDFALTFMRAAESQFRIRCAPLRFRERPTSKRPNGVEYLVHLHSTRAAQLVDSFDRKLLLMSPSHVQCSYLRGIFDAEGSVRFTSRFSGAVAFAQKRKDTTDLVTSLLTSNGINYLLYHHSMGPGRDRIYKLYICRRPSVARFRDLVGFTIIRKARVLHDIVRASTWPSNSGQFRPGHNAHL